MCPAIPLFKPGGKVTYTRPVPGPTPSSRIAASAGAAVLALLLGCATLPRPAGEAGPATPPRGGTVAPLAATPPPVRTVARVTLGAVGDVLMHDAVKQSARLHGAQGGYAWLWAPIADLLAAPDVTFANLETPIAPDSARDVRAFMFDAPPVAAEALRAAGVDVVSVANNHVFDQGRPGFEETLRRVEAAGLRSVGAGPPGHAAGPVEVEAGGLRLAFLGYTYGINQDASRCPAPRPDAPPCLEPSVLDRARAVEDVRAAAAAADAVVVSIHWGVEYAQQPRPEDVELAHRLADAGALVVLGHHPHVLQPVELYRRADGRTAVIAYSLGNFVSNQERFYVQGVSPEASGAPRDGVLLRVAIARRDYGRGLERVEIAGADWLALWTENDTAEIDPKREPGRRPAIRVVSVERALAEVRAEMASFPDPVPPERAEAWIRLRQREALYLARGAAAGAVLGEDLARRLGPAELAVPAAAAPPEAPATPAAAR
jgi:poly-gamma-glutamate synthesis protein (capsule biosynthesis protein)